MPILFSIYGIYYSAAYIDSASWLTPFRLFSGPLALHQLLKLYTLSLTIYIYSNVYFINYFPNH